MPCQPPWHPALPPSLSQLSGVAQQPTQNLQSKTTTYDYRPGLGLIGSTGWFPFGAPHRVAASPGLKLSSSQGSSLSCLMPGLGWQPQLEAGRPLLLSLWPLHIRSLGFLAAWRSRSSWASSSAVVFSQNECSKGLRHKLPGIAFLYSISQVPVRPDSRGRGTDLLSVEGWHLPAGKGDKPAHSPWLFTPNACNPARGHSLRALCSACSRQNALMGYSERFSDR